MRSRRGFLASLGAGGAALGFGLGSIIRGHACDAPRTAAGADTGAVAGAVAGVVAGAVAGAVIEGEPTPLEDLMIEHAVLERVLLIYEAGIRRLATPHGELDPAVIARAGGIIRRYIEDHHERDEEQHVFPRLERVGVELALIQTLRTQHAAGRRLTSEVIDRATAAGVRDPDGRARLAAAMQRFLWMYRPHAARETTVLFPAFRKAVPQAEYDQLRVTLERSERATLGAHVFDTMMSEVCALEAALGIGDLDAFTPEMP
ncbi:MAG TPA: hemerythrin domain-containing protein [Kofleriaceae bacterium]|nr:hemerythrin domain-containing protein [Kofleriaceae bacterium]